MSKKVMMIGIDSATFDLIDPWVQEGKLPAFQRLAAQGVRAPLRSTVPPLTPPAWSTFMTGKNPGQHGMYDFYRLDERFQTKVVTALDRKDKTLWQYLSDAGKRCIVMQVPFTYPPQRLNGILISDFTTPGLDVDFTYPQDFKQTLLKKFPTYRFSADHKYSQRLEDQKAYLQDIVEMTDVQWSVVHELRTQEPWDFFMVTLMGVDQVQHWYWKDMDASHPDHDADDPHGFRDAILKVYQQMDRGLTRLMDELGQDTVLMVMSDHGAGPYLQNVSLNHWLHERGYLHFKSNAQVRLKQMLYALNIHPTTMAKLAFRLGLSRKAGQQRKKEGGRKWMDKLIFSFEDIDWSRTTVYSFGYYGAFYFNTRKRHPLVGIVKESDRPALEERVMKDLSQWRHPETKEKIVTDLWRRDELYHGARVHDLPDIIFSMKDYSYASSSMFAFASNRVFSPPLTFKTGEHRPVGVFYALGAGIPAGRELPEAALIDLAPTILSLFDVPVPSDMEGRIIF